MHRYMATFNLPDLHNKETSQCKTQTANKMYTVGKMHTANKVLNAAENRLFIFYFYYLVLNASRAIHANHSETLHSS